MKHIASLTFSALLLGLSWLANGDWAAAGAPVQLITAGWDIPTPARFHAELAAFEKWGLFAGTVIVPTRK